MGLSKEELGERAERRDAAARGNKYIVAAVLGLMVLGGAGAWLWEQHTHGPFSADAAWGEALAEAAKLETGAALVRLSATYVDEHGDIRAAFSDGDRWRQAGSLVLDFRSAHQEPGAPPKGPEVLGAPAPSANVAGAKPLACPRLHLSTGLHGSGKQTHFGIEHSWREDERCSAPLLTPIRCGVADIWKRAITDGAPHPAYAEVALQASETAEHRGLWRFAIYDRSKGGAPVFEHEYPDDCAP